MKPHEKIVSLKIIWFKKKRRLFLRLDERVYNIYKADDKEDPGSGSSLIVLCIQDNKAFSRYIGEGFLILKYKQ